MIDYLCYEETRNDIRRLLDYASARAFHVYTCVLARTHNRELAGKTASKMFDKIIRKEMKWKGGQICIGRPYETRDKIVESARRGIDARLARRIGGPYD